MLKLQRQYARNEDGSLGECNGVKLLKRPEKAHHIGTQLFAKAVDQGWMKRDGAVITLTAVGGESVAFNVVREPGRYCCHCKVKLPDDGSGAQARAHVAEAHPDQVSPDSENPSGYECINYFDCEVA